MEVVPKPAELLALHDVTTELFVTLQRWFSVPPTISVDVSAVDAEDAVRELGDPTMIAAFAMRKLQALNLLSTPGVRTSTDVVVTMVQDLTRALVQAPVMRLRVQAEQIDWDAAFAALDETSPDTIDDVDAADPEAERFEQLHALLHVAVQAVLDASDGEITYFE
ncbi:MAG TPA: hypothetical protein VGI86_12795 [Acidimicrobiia bacterium]